MPDLKMAAGSTMNDMVYHLEQRIAELEAALSAIRSQTHDVGVDVLSVCEHIYHIADTALGGK